MDWILVTENIPKDGSYVIVSLDNMYVDIAFYRLGRFVLNTKQVYPNAWMPLPRPYKVGRHERW